LLHISTTAVFHSAVLLDASSPRFVQVGWYLPIRRDVILDWRDQANALIEPEDQAILLTPFVLWTTCFVASARTGYASRPNTGN
jgi:hypothetical protein